MCALSWGLMKSELFIRALHSGGPFRTVCREPYIGLCILCECVHKICIANENLYAVEFGEQVSRLRGSSSGAAAGQRHGRATVVASAGNLFILK